MIAAMADLLGKVARFARRYDLFLAGQILVAGVSGGPDSLCLLHILTRLAPGLDLQLHVAHLNHGLRGAEAEADARFVATLAHAWKLHVAVGTADVAGLARREGLSLEEAARHARYRFLADVAGSVGARLIAVGHSADDQAETVLMHLLRGSGVAGLRGMLPRTDLSDYHLGAQVAQPVVLVRPLLETTRAEIRAYCEREGLEPRTDESNAALTFFRNRLRHSLMPLLEEYNPAIREVLAHTATLMAGEYEVLAESVERAWTEILRGAGHDEVYLDRAAWRALPVALQRATLRHGIQQLRRSLRNVNWEHVEQALWLANEGTTGQSATLTAGLALEIGYDLLRLGPEAARGVPPADPVPQIYEPIRLLPYGTTVLPGGWAVVVRQMALEEVPVYYAAGIDRWTAWLDADSLGMELILRPRVPGDRFRPQGLGGHSVRVNEFMINAKVPRAARARWPILEGARGIGWLCGLRVDELAIVKQGTRHVWEIAFKRKT